MKPGPLLLGLCLLGRATLGGEPIESFAGQSLGIDLASVPFGTIYQTNSEFKRAEPPGSTDGLITDAAISWMTNSVSANYSHDFPNRILRYGFRDGQLVAVRISLSAISGPNAFVKDNLEPRQKELIKIQGDLLKASPIHKLNFTDSSYRLQYGAMCAPIPESLFLVEIEISRVAPKKTPQ